MKKLTQIKQAECRALRAEIDKHLEALAALGVVAHAGNATFEPDGTGCTFKLKVTLAGVNPKQAEFNRHAFAYGLAPSDFGAAFTVPGRNGTEKHYTIAGVQPRSGKWPLLVTTPTGEVVALPYQAIDHYLKTKAVA